MIKVSRLCMFEVPRTYYLHHMTPSKCGWVLLTYHVIGGLYGESDNPEGARRVQQPAIKPCFSKQLQLTPPKDFSNQLRRSRLI